MKLIEDVMCSLPSRKLHGKLWSRMPKQSLVGASNAWKKLLVPAHTRSDKKI